MNVSAQTLKMLLLTMTLASVLAGCGTGTLIDAAGVRRIVGTDLIGTKGATEADQDKINRTVVRLGAGKIYTAKELAAHGQQLEARQ